MGTLNERQKLRRAFLAGWLAAMTEANADLWANATTPSNAFRAWWKRRRHAD